MTPERDGKGRSLSGVKQAGGAGAKKVMGKMKVTSPRLDLGTFSVLD
jgi:hypothetical protein